MQPEPPQGLGVDVNVDPAPRTPVGAAAADEAAAYFPRGERVPVDAAVA